MNEQKLMNLSDDQRELLLELADRYFWMSPNEFQAKLKTLLREDL